VNIFEFTANLLVRFFCRISPKKFAGFIYKQLRGSHKPRGSFSFSRKKYGVKLSVLMSVYYKDNAGYLAESLNSVFQQTLQPDEVVLVQDGPLSDELLVVAAQAVKEHGDLLKVIPLPVNVGLQNALNEGLKHCSGEWVARMDADDVCLPERFKVQMEHLAEDPDIDVIGSWIDERDEKLETSIACRKVPQQNDKIIAYAKWRNPMNHMTVMFRKDAVLAAGGYPDCLKFEDYALWATMLKEGFIFANIPRVLLLARTGEDFYDRRSGWDYFHYERRLLAYLLKIRFVNIFEFTVNFLVRFCCRILPRPAVRFIYDVLRKK
jgi:glycosyltransferase involved in cell wall biosynthesis